ncbi:MAG: DUF4430 domain-containing protein [Oscillospiraceae bacterium]|nr:DUF4430 domain-containing protein [Oscillospiraceae bacterium]
MIGAAIVIVLAFVFWYGGNAPGLRGWKPRQETSEAIVQNEVALPTETDVPDAELTENEADAAPETAQETAAAMEEAPESPPLPAETANEDIPEENAVEIDETAEKDKYQTEPIPEDRPVPIEPQDAVISDTELTCTLSVRCDSILDNMAWLDAEKAELVPSDGVIYAERTVTFYEGESVFNLLLREMKQNKIHMEYENTPIYSSAYIEGIGNLYEFDCGELSGWMYMVNGWFPNYGCSRYRLMAGDRVEWVYTCDLGEDVGGSYSARNGK